MSKSLVKNAADEEQVGEAKKAEKYRRDRDLNDLRVILNLPEGRRFLARYLAGVDHECVDHSGSFTYYQLGQRKILLKLKSEVIEASFEKFQLMEKEHHSRGETDV